MNVQPNAAIPPLVGVGDADALGATRPDESAGVGSTDLALHLDRVRRHRSELRESVAAVDLALEAPIARGGMWRERVRAALAELAHDFDDHVALTESPGGSPAGSTDCSPSTRTCARRSTATWPSSSTVARWRTSRSSARS